MIGYFGNVKFEVSDQHIRTFRSFTGKHSAAYAIHDILDGKQKLQYVGQNLSERSLTIRLATDIRPPHGKGARQEIRTLTGMGARQEIRTLTGMVNSGRAWPLVLGTTPYGRFVLEGMTEDETRFDGHGDMTAATLTLQLREYH